MFLVIKAPGGWAHSLAVAAASGHVQLAVRDRRIGNGLGAGWAGAGLAGAGLAGDGWAKQSEDQQRGGKQAHCGYPVRATEIGTVATSITHSDSPRCNKMMKLLQRAEMVRDISGPCPYSGGLWQQAALCPKTPGRLPDRIRGHGECQ